MSQPIAVVIGATGGQGGSVVDSFLADGTYRVRGVTRNINSTNAQALKKRGVDVVTADLNDQASLVQAFKVAIQYCLQDYADTPRTLLSYLQSRTFLSLSQRKGRNTLCKSSPRREST